MTFSIERKSKVLSCQNSIFKSVWCVTPHLLMVNQKWSEAFSRVDATSSVRWCHHHRVASTKPLYARRGTISAKKLRGVVLLFQSSFPAIQQKYPRHEYFKRSEATAESENLHFKMGLKLRSGLLMRELQKIWLSKKVELSKTRLLRKCSAKFPATSL